MYNVNINGVILISPKKENMVNVTFAENNFGVKVDTLIKMCKNVVTAPILRIESTSGKVYDYVFCSIEAITNGYSAFFKTDIDTMEVAISTVNKTFACEFVDNATIMAEFTTDPANPSVIDTEIEQSPQSVTVNFDPIQASGTPTPTDPIAIYGHDEVELTGYGKNLIPATLDNVKTLNSTGTWEDNAYTLNGVTFTVHANADGYITGVDLSGTASEQTEFALTNLDASLDAGTYFISGVPKDSTTIWLNTVCPKSTSGYWIDSRVDGRGFSATVGENDRPYYLRIRVASTYTGSATVYPMIEVGTEGTAFEPYRQGAVISVNLPETVYGGVWDVERGVMTVNREIVDLGDLTWTYYSGENSRFGATVTGIKQHDSDGTIANIKCSCYKPNTAGDIWLHTEDLIIGVTSAPSQLWVYDSNYDDADAFKTAVTGQKLVYELAIPYEIQLTPEQVTFLEGTNTLFTNGTSIVVEYTKGRVATQADIASLGKDLNSVVDFAKRAFIGKEKTFSLTYTDETLAGAVGELYDDLIEYLLTKDANYRFSLVSIKADDTTDECFARDRKVYDNTFDGSIIADVNVGTALTYIEGKDTGSYVRTFDYSTGTYTDVSATDGSGTATLKIEEYLE